MDYLNNQVQLNLGHAVLAADLRDVLGTVGIEHPGRQYPGKQWDAWYAYPTEKHGLSRKPAFVGMSKGGVNEYRVNEYTWATSNPDKVSCIYADNPDIYPEDIPRIGELIKHDVPLFNVCGTLDFDLTIVLD